MPWRLIQFILIFLILLLFVAFNLNNKCEINFGFGIAPVKDVPVYMTAFFAFAFGMFCTLPYIIKLRIKRKKTEAGTVEKTKKSSGKKAGKLQELQEDSSFSDGGPYGVN